MTSPDLSQRADGHTHSRPLVCFDLGGVLVRICRTWQESCERAGIPVRGDVTSEERKAMRRETTRAFSDGRITLADWLERLTASLGGLYSADEVRRIHNAWIIEEYPGWEALLNDMNEAGIVTSCLSNTNASHWARMMHVDELGCSPASAEPEFPNVRRIKHPHASHLIGCSKPDARIYSAFERLRGVAGREILFFDDLPENVAAANDRGWRAVEIDPDASPADQVRSTLVSLELL